MKITLTIPELMFLGFDKSQIRELDELPEKLSNQIISRRIRNVLDFLYID